MRPGHNHHERQSRHPPMIAALHAKCPGPRVQVLYEGLPARELIPLRWLLSEWGISLNNPGRDDSLAGRLHLATPGRRIQLLVGAVLILLAPIIGGLVFSYAIAEDADQSFWNALEDSADVGAYGEDPDRPWRAVPRETVALVPRSESPWPAILAVGVGLGWVVLVGFLMLPSRPEDDASLRKRSELIDSMLDGLTDGLIVADSTGKILISNQKARRIAGPGSADTPIADWSKTFGFFRPGSESLFPPDQLPLAQAIQGKTVEEEEVFVRNYAVPEGTWVSVNGSPLLGEDGEVQGGVIVFRDISRRKRAEQRLQRLSNAVDQTADAVFITDREGCIEYVNPAFQSITGFAENEALGSNPRMLKSGLQDDSFYEELWTTILDGESFRGNSVNRRKDGTLFHAEQTITPIKDVEGEITHFVSVLKDITERRKLQQQEIELEIASRVQSRLFPATPPSIQGFDLGCAVFPAEETCGDYFDFLKMPNGAVGIVIADVSGHGVGPALVMAQTRASLRSLARDRSDPGEILAEINDILVSDLGENFFVTMLMATLDTKSGALKYANAGHPEGWVMTDEGVVRAALDSTGVPLGLFPDRVFECRDARLDPGEMLVLLTDGVFEAESPEEEEFGPDRTVDVIRSSRRRSAQDVVAALYHATCEFSRKKQQADDITLVVCKRESSD